MQAGPACTGVAGPVIRVSPLAGLQGCVGNGGAVGRVLVNLREQKNRAGRAGPGQPGSVIHALGFGRGTVVLLEPGLFVRALVLARDTRLDRLDVMETHETVLLPVLQPTRVAEAR